jgi:hypothetical protein
MYGRTRQAAVDSLRIVGASSFEGLRMDVHPACHWHRIRSFSLWSVFCVGFAGHAMMRYARVKKF